MAKRQFAKEVDQTLREVRRAVEDREQRELHVCEIEEAILEAVSSRLFGPDLEPGQLERLVESSDRLGRMVQALKDGHRVVGPLAVVVTVDELCAERKARLQRAHRNCDTVCRAGEHWGRCNAGIDHSNDVVIN